MSSTTHNVWLTRARTAVNQMTKQEALAFIAECSKPLNRGIVNSPIRKLTGGFASQSICFAVMRLLGTKAGICK